MKRPRAKLDLTEDCTGRCAPDDVNGERNGCQEFWFAKDRMMWVWLDGGQVQLLELDYLQEAAGTRQNLLGIAVGFRYDLRSLHGLPVFFNYGHGLLTPKDAVEAHRREFAVIVAAGF